ncbi:hypothetical protein HN51_050341 [Arachis hypogaea]|uniref:Methyltransferase-related protein n=1 Tax=Arachis hypogaea TaxID=3818 RepID=A0A444YC01_ARAHY|nr:uncharacterized protein LOC107609081 [Arachis ipaensis]XP_020963124.1 uncharacterized protein LOC107609081 [Arachis ipaensis]XP_025665794.1 uncharacterized protein LOC112764425 [Arachis hypogaea]XP_029150300.1 uncharacterized protein LOC112764425 [Arachis hypogaea]QHN92077.1 uncharacterized protein DS421_17g580530 [Arachis hypogaea]RYQ99347.1 hypothetical protein Ahy_B07g087278 [Arachis hypogaea]
MCPLRVILIFLSATLAGFFLLRNIRSQPPQLDNHDDDDDDDSTQNSHSSNSSSSKIGSAINSGFWTLVDMASGRYLWRHRHLVSSTQSS